MSQTWAAQLLSMRILSSFENTSPVTAQCVLKLVSSSPESTCQIRAVPSSPPVATRLPSCENATESTRLECPSSRCPGFRTSSSDDAPKQQTMATSNGTRIVQFLDSRLRGNDGTTP